LLPRRHRLAGKFDRGIRAGTLRPTLDVDAVTSMLIGSLYARYLASSEVPPDWPERVVGSLWPAIQADRE
jgi:hypothetical protein